MTWSRFDDAAPKSPKARAAGNEAWSLWAAAVMYCNRHLTDGYITLAALATDCLPVPISLAKARKLADKLCDEAKITPDGAGLFERSSKDVWKVHDFDHWNPSKAEVEAKRQWERDRKRNRVPSSPGGGNDGNPGGFPTGKPGGNPDGNPGGNPLDSRPDSGGLPTGKPPGKPAGNPDGFRSPAGAPARIPAQPAQPSQSEDQGAPAAAKDLPAERPASGETGGGGRIHCPPDLELTEAQKLNLEIGSGIPRWAVDELTAEFRATHADGAEARALHTWRSWLVSRISARWSDPNRRPRAPGAPSAHIDDLVARSARLAEEEADTANGSAL